MGLCSVPFCKSSSKRKKSLKLKHIFFHEFPSDLDTRIKWIKAVSRKDPETNGLWFPLSGYSTVCSLHFEKSCYRTPSSYISTKQPCYKQLKKGSIPTIFPPPQHSDKPKNQLYTSSDDEDVDEPSSSSNAAVHSSTAVSVPLKTTLEHSPSMIISSQPITAAMNINSQPIIPSMNINSQSIISSMNINSQPIISSININSQPIISSMNINSQPIISSMNINSQPIIPSMNINSQPIISSMNINSQPIIHSMNINSQPISVKEDSFSEVSKLSSNAGSLFQPPVLIEDEIVSEDEL